MSAFEIDNECCGGDVSPFSSNRVKDECIIALKVYDFCRHLDCNIIQL